MRGLRRRAWVAIAFASALAPQLATKTARADAVSAELGGGVGKASASLPSSSFAYAKLGGRVALGDAFTVSASGRVTHDFAVPAAANEPFATSDDWVTSFGLGLAWDITPHFGVSLEATGSPPAKRKVATGLTVTPARADIRDPLSTSALVATKNGSGGASLTLSYDSFDDDETHAVDVSIDLYGGVTGYSTTAALDSIDAGSAVGVVTQGSLADRCGRSLTGLACAAAGVPSRSAWLTQARVGLTPTVTIAEDTDVAVDGAFYVYDTDKPDDVGFFSDSVGGRTVSWGAGVPLLPPRWSVRPEVGQRIGALSLRAYYQYTATTIDGLSSHGIGGRAQVAIDRWKPYVTASSRFDAGVSTATSWTAGLGVSRSF